MSARLACWLRGHDWKPVGQRVYSDLFDNQWRIQTCAQCAARRRVLHRSWSEEVRRG